MRQAWIAYAVCAAALLLGVLATPASAKPIVGMGDQKLQMFEDPRVPWLGIRHARIVVPWYIETAHGDPAERRHLKLWLDLARKRGIEPLLGFGHGFYGPMRTYLPTNREFRQAFRAFKRRYPWIRTYIPWNEANHCSQPTCKRPERAAQYFDALRSGCPKCTVTAPAVIDQPNMVRWLRSFERAAKHRPRIYALHNYLDVNRLQTRRTKRLLKAVKGRIWITETGGVVFRKHYKDKADFPESPEHAGRVTQFLLDTASKLSPRIERVYLYHWNTDRPEPQWDSGLVDWYGLARPSFAAVATFVGRNPLLAPALPPVRVPLPDPPRPTPPPAGAQPDQTPPPQNSNDQQKDESPPAPSQPTPPERPSQPTDPVCSIIDPCVGGLGG